MAQTGVAQSLDLLKLCGSCSEKAAGFEQHGVRATLLGPAYDATERKEWSVARKCVHVSDRRKAEELIPPNFYAKPKTRRGAWEKAETREV